MSIKQYFFQNKMKNYCSFCTNVSFRFQALGTPSAGAARNREIMKPW